MSMFNDIGWTKTGNSLDCISNSKEVRDYAKRGFSEDTGHSSVLEMKRNCMERIITNQKENETMKPIR